MTFSKAASYPVLVNENLEFLLIQILKRNKKGSIGISNAAES